MRTLSPREAIQVHEYETGLQIQVKKVIFVSDKKFKKEQFFCDLILFNSILWKHLTYILENAILDHLFCPVFPFIFRGSE